MPNTDRVRERHQEMQGCESDSGLLLESTEACRLLVVAPTHCRYRMTADSQGLPDGRPVSKSSGRPAVVSDPQQNEASFCQEAHFGAYGSAGRRPDVSLCWIRQVAEPKSRYQGVSRCAAIGVAPTRPPGSAMSPAGVDDQLSIHGVRDLTLEGASASLVVLPSATCDRSTAALRRGSGFGRWRSRGWHG